VDKFVSSVPDIDILELDCYSGIWQAALTKFKVILVFVDISSVPESVGSSLEYPFAWPEHVLRPSPQLRLLAVVADTETGTE
jgi:hypothetical protein